MPGAQCLRKIDPYRLDLRVVVERVHAHLAADATLFVAAKGRGRVVDVVSVDPDRAGLKFGRDVVRLLDVARPDAGGQAVDRVVGAGDGLIDVREVDRREHR